jgi:hypothetical protein
LEEKQYDNAIIQYLNSNKLFPNRLNTLYGLAKSYLENKNILSSNKYFGLITELCNSQENLVCLNETCNEKYDCNQRIEMIEVFIFFIKRHLILSLTDIYL